MRGKLRAKKLVSGKLSLYIDYYPPVWNPQKKVSTNRAPEIVLVPGTKNRPGEKRK